MEQQFDQYANSQWSPEHIPCRFVRDQEFELARWTPGPRHLTPLGGIAVNEYNRTHEEYTQLFEEHYRCETHGCPPEVFRQSAPITRRWNRIIKDQYERVTMGNWSRTGFAQVPWPDNVRDPWRDQRRYGYIDALRATSTHRLW